MVTDRTQSLKFHQRIHGYRGNLATVICPLDRTHKFYLAEGVHLFEKKGHTIIPMADTEIRLDRDPKFKAKPTQLDSCLYNGWAVVAKHTIQPDVTVQPDVDKPDDTRVFHTLRFLDNADSCQNMLVKIHADTMVGGGSEPVVNYHGKVMNQCIQSEASRVKGSSMGTFDELWFMYPGDWMDIVLGFYTHRPIRARIECERAECGLIVLYLSY